MPRPSQQLDAQLLAAGRRLLPSLGCQGLSVRAVCEAAGVRPAMLHYHFGSKDAFLAQVLQQLYEEMYAGLTPLECTGPALPQLRAALLHLGRFATANRPLLSRVLLDALSGQPVAQAFLRRNAPRHLGLLARLLAQAQQEGALPPGVLATRLTFLMGAVMAPLLMAGLVEQESTPALPLPLDALLAPEALARRVDMALRGLMSKESP